MKNKKNITTILNIVLVLVCIGCILFAVYTSKKSAPSDMAIGIADGVTYTPSIQVGKSAEPVYITYPGLADNFTLDAKHPSLPLYNDESNTWYMDYVVTIEEVPDYFFTTKMLAPGPESITELNLYDALDAGVYTVHFNIYVSPNPEGNLDSLGTPYDYVGTVTIVK